MSRDFELMAAEEVLNAVGLTGILLYFLAPTILAILCIYYYNKTKARRKKIKAAKQAAKNATMEEDKLPNKLTDRPEQMEKFKGLALEFDESGHVK